jgi:5S rRNA maturation endonuclease (ribonuclease M5)/transcription antitermination factor NusG
MFNITNFIDFDSKGRAQCPCCLSFGKNGKNLSLIPDTDGAYKCHRGCTPDGIRSALGQPPIIDAQIPVAVVRTTAKPKYHTPQELKANTDKLLNQSKLAKKWLSDRGIDEEAIARHRLGIVQKKIDDKVMPCISVPYEINTGQWLQKYFVSPWLPSNERLNSKGEQVQRIKQDTGLAARWWFTRKTDAKEIWICEGEWDAIVMANHLGDRAIDVCTSTTGAGNVPNDLSPLARYDRICIFYDLDEAGKAGAEKLAGKLGDRAKIATVPHPENCKAGYDVTDALGDKFAIENFIESAKVAIGPPPTKNELRERLITTQELLDRAPDFVEFLVHDLITANELQVIAAPPRAGKSLLTLGLVNAIATGKEFMDRPTQQGDVIYVNVEDGDAKLKERVIAQGWDVNAPVHWLTEFSLSEWEKLLAVCEEIKPKLLVIDTLTSVRDDEADENSSKISNLLKPLKSAAKRLNFAVILVHHTKKLNASSLNEIDVFDTMRGSGVIRSECRGAIVLAEVNNPNTNRNEWRLLAENGSYSKQDLVIVLDANTLTWQTLSNWTPNCSDSQEAQALAYFDKVGQASIQQLSSNTSIPTKSAYTVVTRLVQRGMLVKQGSRQNAVYTRAIQQIQQLNSLLNSPNDFAASDSASNSTKNIIFISTDDQVQKTADQQPVNTPLPQSVELEPQMQAQQVNQQFNSNSTKPSFVELAVGDRVEITTGRFAGRSCFVVGFDGETYEVTNDKWAINRNYPREHLKKLTTA